MILQEEFKKSGYKDILVEDIASEYEIDLKDIFELNQKPEELLSIFISEQGDDLFFLLDGDLMGIDSLCDRWDDRIRVFTIINGKSKAIHIRCHRKQLWSSYFSLLAMTVLVSC